eukprot:1846-Prymnesium_polylepis.1
MPAASRARAQGASLSATASAPRTTARYAAARRALSARATARQVCRAAHGTTRQTPTWRGA